MSKIVVSLGPFRVRAQFDREKGVAANRSACSFAMLALDAQRRMGSDRLFRWAEKSSARVVSPRFPQIAESYSQNP